MNDETETNKPESSENDAAGGLAETDRSEALPRGVLSPDRPLVDPLDDRLGYAPFAEALARSVRSLDSPDGIVVGIYGAWGLGKTTALNFVERYLTPDADTEKEDPDLVVLRFNPWLFTGRLDLAAVYLLELQKVFQQRKLATDRAREALASLLKLAGAVPIPGADAGTRLAAMVDPGSPDIRKQRDEVRDALAEQPQRLVVVIDDMDRLTAQEIKELFSVIKSVADFPNTVYLLAFDKNVVAEALAPGKPDDGMAYIEKIVQVPFELPLPDPVVLQGVLLEQLGAIVGRVHTDLIDAEEWSTALRRCVMPLLDTPRDVVRLTNSLKVTYGAVRDQVNVVDFILIETARIFLSPLYDAIRARPEMFGVTRDVIQAAMLFEQKDEQEAFHKTWLKKIAKERREAAKSLSVTLFPTTSEALDTMKLASRARRDDRRERRITEPTHFSLYFSLALGESVLSRELVLAMLEKANQPTEFCKALLDLRGETIPGGRTRASVMLDELVAQAESGFKEREVPDLVEAIVSVADEFWIDADDAPLSAGNDDRIFWFVEGLLTHLPKEERAPVLGRAIEQGRAVATSVRIVHGLEANLEVRTGSITDADVHSSMDEHALIASGDLRALEEVTATRIGKAASDGSLLGAPKLLLTIMKWADWGGVDPVREWLGKVLADDDALSRLLVGLLLREPLKDGREPHRLNPAWLEPYAPREEMVTAVRRIEGAAADEVKEAVDAFFADLTLLEAGQNPDDPFRDLRAGTS